MIALPPYIDPEAWAGFAEMRNAMRKIPFTTRAQMMILAELQKIKDAGHDPNAALDQSTLNGWRDVWAPRAKDIPRASKPAAVASTNSYLTQQQEHLRLAEAERKNRQPIKLVRQG